MRISIFYLLILLLDKSAAQEPSFIYPGKQWLDNNGKEINAHGGGFMYHSGVYYWYGEHKLAGKTGNKAHVGVHVYSSKDLINWEDQGIALAVVENDSTHEIAKGCIIERPKVVYNEATKRYVMWFHLELKGEGYKAARTAVATSKSPVGPFKYVKSYRPHKGVWPTNFPDSLRDFSKFDFSMSRKDKRWRQQVENGFFLVRDFESGQMSRDMTLFKDNGKLYHIHAAEENQTLHISELSPDYLSFTDIYYRILPGKRNEAPSIIKRNGTYFMISSGLTGWKPNAARLHTASEISGPWTYQGNPCRGDSAAWTFGAQSTYILGLERQDRYIFIADKWKPKNPIDGRYVWLPLAFSENEQLFLNWTDRWNMHTEARGLEKRLKDKYP